MTFREKLKEEYPDCVSDRYVAGAKGCPFQYGYGDTDNNKCPAPGMSCRDCWDREMLEPEVSNICDGRKILETEDQEDDINVSIWPEVAILAAFLGLFFIIAVSQMI